MASFITHPYFNESEGVDPSDFNELAQCLRAQMWDYIAAQLFRGYGEENPAANGGPRVMTVGNGGQCRPIATARSVQLHSSGGTIMLPGGGESALNGVAPRFVPYGFDSTYTHNLQFDDNVSGFDRYDVIQVKIDYFQVATANAGNDQEARDVEDASVEPHVVASQLVPKRKNSVLTASIKKGIEDGSLVEPSVDVGYAKMYAVKIANALGAGFITAADIRDYRVPIGFSKLTTFGCNAGFTAAEWTRTEAIVADGGGARVAYFFPAGGSPCMSGRLVRVGVAADIVAGSGATAKLIRYDKTGAVTVLVDLSADLLTAGGGAIYRAKSMIDSAYWMNGYEAGSAVEYGLSNLASRLGIMITSGNSHADVIRLVDFDVAGV